MNDKNTECSPAPDDVPEPPEVEVVIEAPCGNFLKRGSAGHVDFVSPLPCPFNYGAAGPGATLAKDGVRLVRRSFVPGRETICGMDRRLSSD